MIDRARITSHVSNAELDRLLSSFADRLLEALPSLPVTTVAVVLTDEEVVAALSADDATLMFASSQPCWTKEENNVTDLDSDSRSRVERLRGAVSKAVGAGS